MINQLISAIQEKIPVHIKPVTYLMDTLDLGRESAYRRLRGEIPFSFEEVALLAQRLEFSVDEIVANKPNKSYSDFPSWNEDGSEKFLGMMKRFSKSFYLNSAEVIVSQNRANFSTLMYNNDLLQFYYYRFLHQINYIDSNCILADVQLPEKILTFQKQFINNPPEVKKITYICDKRMLRNLCKEIQYFYRRKLLSQDEFFALKKALTDLTNMMHQRLSHPQNDNQTLIYYYVSMFDISINTTFIQHESNLISKFWVFPFSIIEIKNSEICQLHRSFLDMLKRYSVLISQSNELAREKFFAQQHKYINSMTDNNPNPY
ncbi:MAG: hypothetical protein LBS01_06215 [Prevotellaceae bacterium]|jgi:hypothetical protein|nr:hypothetical protein [Prevotellaceae bacterium]